ncbi:ATP-binding protein [Thiomicrospira sp. WB1]|uniref:ATP-binding protein n=1 Tax=Thiomicrospira sp. WB1 TaxID=1685380 RepID=UPI0007477BF0|nr:ATP-binding protein [Thiomicrospira sp. WB1]KUJ72265.1 hypothetical protein AVO41_00125 [Thiomicrospira sp. WB1]
MKSTLIRRTPRNLFLLLMVFVVGFGLQAILNHSIDRFISALDQKVANAEVETLIGQQIKLDIYKIESDFYQLATFPNQHLRRIILEDIRAQQADIAKALNTLNQGGTYRHQIDLNLPNTDTEYEILTYEPPSKEHFSFARADILPKFPLINHKARELADQLADIDRQIAETPQALTQAIDHLKLEVKFFKPLFHRLKEDANRISYNAKQNFQALQADVTRQKNAYRQIQMILTLTTLLLGLAFFWSLSRNIRKTTEQIEASHDYTHDILASQDTLIIVNDGKKLVDASGGFFKFFQGYDTIEAFRRDYDCVCDLFAREPGYLYKFDDQDWLDYVLQHPNTIHKAKVCYQDRQTVFQVSVAKSRHDQRYIISMFDITENERINQALAEQKDKALAATEAKGQFLANMSHEIRTPMNAILGFISLLKEKPLDAEAREYLQTIDNASQSLLGIINDILDLSKIESGHLRIDPSEFDPHKEFNVTADLFKARSSEKNIYFELTLPKQLPPGLKTDVLRLKQVLNNLLSNAVKFTEPNHRIQLQIDYQENDPKNHQAWLHFNVTDEGIGMTPEQLEKVFEAFTQAESHTMRQYGGTGLGLTISARLVEMLGGQLKATSTPGRGSCFYFAIPVEKVARPIETSKDDSQAPSLRGHVLLVEDNQTNQLLMSAILKKIGLTLDIASDGFEAIECVQKHDYDLVLMDENMPNLNGIEATREIRQLGTRYETLPIIALTANAMTGDRERFLAAGMDEYLSKPVNLSKLIEVVQPFLSAPQARKE